jgi:F-type H+-transporting ATPase subunit delta
MAWGLTVVPRCRACETALDREIIVAGEHGIVSGMAGRYATALFELALEERSLDAVKVDLDRFDALVAESADLQRLVKSPVFTAEEQTRALSAILDNAAIGGLAGNFLKVLVKNRRLFAVRDIISGFRALVSRHKGEVTAQVTLAEAPSEQHLDAIKDALKAVTRKDVQVEVKLDPSIIGGLIVKLGSRMVDSSLRTKLNALKLAMKEVS